MASAPGVRVLYISLVFLWQSATPTFALSLEPDNYGFEGHGDIFSLLTNATHDKNTYPLQENQVKQGSNYVSNMDSNSYTRKIRDVPDHIEDYFDMPDPCCGSAINTDQLSGEPTGKFSLIETLGSIKITDVTDPCPSKVNDFKKGTIQRDNTYIPSIVYHTTLTWTAPREELDSCIVSSYSLRFSQNQTYLDAKHFDLATEYNISDVQYTNILKNAGTEVSLNISLELPTFVIGDPYYFALNSQDKKGNISPISNLVQLILQPPSTSSSPSTTPLVTIINIAHSSLHVSWTIDSHAINKVVVTWTSKSGESNNKEVENDVKDLFINGIVCNTEYNITVTAHNDQNVISSVTVLATTKDTVPGKAIIKKINPDDSDPTKLVVHWSAAEYSCSGGLLNYHLIWQADDFTLNKYKLYGLIQSYTIPNILYNNTYNVFLAAISQTGIVGPMDSQLVDTMITNPNSDIPGSSKTNDQDTPRSSTIPGPDTTSSSKSTSPETTSSLTNNARETTSSSKSTSPETTSLLTNNARETTSSSKSASSETTSSLTNNARNTTSSSKSTSPETTSSLTTNARETTSSSTVSACEITSKPKKKCKIEGGSCKSVCGKDEEEIRKGCRGGDCKCCIKKQNCKAKKKCKKANGKCRKNCKDNEGEIPRGCKGGKKCKCCVSVGSTTPNS